MGQVFEARDARDGTLVAIKTLHNVDPKSLYKLKREYRAMADIVHINLVTLHELVVANSRCFIAMEYVEGRSFLDTIRGLGDNNHRLRALLRQLASGLRALHIRGRVHRDITPGNVLVTGRDRVVILDFGLTSVVERQTLFTDMKGVGQGTPDYMAPEQILGQLATPATDWYAVGGLLYTALSGHPPFEARGLHALLQQKLFEQPRPIAAICPGVDPELAELVMGLLRRDPEQRFGLGEVLSWCADARAPTPRDRPPPKRRLLDRDGELDELRGAFSAITRGANVFVDVVGAPGTGKTALVEAFLEFLRGRESVVILEASCSQREFIAFRAFDGVVDGLASYLRNLPTDGQEEFVRDCGDAFASLLPVFPVLERVGLSQVQPARPAEDQHARRVAFASFKQVLYWLGQRVTLVVTIDDLHHADSDSTRLLCELLTPPGPPRLLLVCAYEPAAFHRSPALSDLELLRAMITTDGSRRVVETRPLRPDYAVEHVLQLQGGIRTPTAVAQARAIAAESAGNPMLIETLVQELIHEPSAPPPLARHPKQWLRQLLLGKLNRLLPAARELLILIILAHEPIPIEILTRACSTRGSIRTLLTQLEGVRLVRVTGASGTAQHVEPYHKPLRGLVDVLLPEPELMAQRHLDLAEAYRVGGQHHEQLAYHLNAAGQPRNAAIYAVRAAAAANRSLAYDRAACLYTLAIECDPDSWKHYERCAAALINAGRRHEAAELYVSAAARHSANANALLLEASDQLLICGYTERGIALLEPFLQRLTIAFPRSADDASSVIKTYARKLQERGFAFTPYAERALPAIARERLDVLWIAARGLLLNDPLRAAAFALRLVFESLEAGEPTRIARSLALASIIPLEGELENGAVLLEAATNITTRFKDEYTMGLTAICRGVRARHEGAWIEALSDLTHGTEYLELRVPGLQWEPGLAQRSAFAALEARGELRSISHKAQRLHLAARERGDIHLILLAATYSSLCLLAADEPREAHERTQNAMALWTQPGFHAQHINALKIETLCDLYEDREEAAWRRVVERWPQIERSNFLSIPSRRVEILRLRARVTIAYVASEPRRASHLLAVAEQDVHQLEQERGRHLRAEAALLRAGLLTIYGDERGSLRQLEIAIVGFERAQTALMAACASWAKAQRLGAGESRAQAELRMHLQGIAAPSRWVRAHAPGLLRG
ncbi:MAG: serine/threonine-protein kinase PknK [Myxococcales bacterium]|nr:serine/threonine-protein kinase PknK [Myxococcales bacterium]